MTFRPRPSFRDMIGKRVASVVVVRRAANQGNGSAAWFVQCSEGHEFVVTGSHLRDAVKRGAEVICCNCNPKHSTRRKVRAEIEYSPSTLSTVHALMCGVCHEQGHTRSTCPTRIGAQPKYCNKCSGLAHRRPPEGCPGCGGQFIPERAPTLADAMKMPNHNRREVA